jgi:23S rRNA-/tRNA-specific pseudouridylate synthase
MDRTMTSENVPKQPPNSFRVTLTVASARPRIDAVLLEELRRQKRNLALRNISRTEFKELFRKKRVRIKGQPATPSSSLAQGTTYVDIMGFSEEGP